MGNTSQGTKLNSNIIMNDLKLINKVLKGPQVPFSCNMILPRKPRKILKGLRRIGMQVMWQS